MSSLMGGGPAQIMLDVQVEGAPLDPLIAGSLRRVEVSTDMTIADEITLWFSDPDDTVMLLGGLIIGAIITIEADETASLPDPWILSVGQITGIETRIDHNGRTLIVHALDRSHAMMRGRSSMAWPPGDYSEPVEILAAKAGLIPFVIPTGVESVTMPGVSQANQSDWEFCQQLARETNSLCFTRQDTLYFIPPGMPLPPSGLLDPEPTPPETATLLLPGQLYFGANLTRLSTTVRAADQVGTVIVPAVDPLAPDAPIPGMGPLLTDLMDNMEQPMEVGALVEASDAMFVYTDIPVDPEAVEQLAMSFGERLANAYCEIDGETSGTAWLTAGINVGIGGTGLTTDGMYMVTSARHVFDESHYVTEFTCAGIRDVTFGGLANSEWQQTKRHLIHGVVTGIVTAVGDPEDPGAPKCQLMFPWLSVEYLSPFAPVVQPGGAFGPAFAGNILTPMVGQEVLVAFDRGDIRAPYVIGGLYNGINEAIGPLGPVVTEDLVLGQVYMSQTGHSLTFSDDPAAPMILMQTNDQMISIMMAVEEGALVIQNTPDCTITMMATGEIMVSGGSITIMGEESISIMAPDITIAGEASVTVSGASISVMGDGDVSIGAPAITIGPG